jgi:hypothetical protein
MLFIGFVRFLELKHQHFSIASLLPRSVWLSIFVFYSVFWFWGLLRFRFQGFSFLNLFKLWFVFFLASFFFDLLKMLFLARLVSLGGNAAGLFADFLKIGISILVVFFGSNGHWEPHRRSFSL